MTDSRLASSFVQARLYRVNPGRPLRLIVIHDMEAPEGPGTAESCARFFAGPSAGGSAHYCVDVDSVVQCVKEADQAAHAPGANTDGIGIELNGYARQSRDEWLDDTSRQTMSLAAALVRDISARTGIPPKWLSDDEVRAGAKGITTHAAISRIYRQSDHTDPGPEFPADVFMDMVNVNTPQSIADPPKPGGSHHMLSTVTLPPASQSLPNCGVEARAALGTVVLRWQPEVGGNWCDWQAITQTAPPFPVDSVELRAAANGALDVLAWSTVNPAAGVIRAWQSDPGGSWNAWAAA